MPTVAIVEGVKIQFYADEHPPPHFHAIFAEHVAQIQIQPVKVLRGSLPQNKLESILRWAEDHSDFLIKAWIALAEGRKPPRLK